MKFHETKLNETMVRSQGDNSEIINEIQRRLQFGLDKYGHGVRISDDMREVGNTKRNSFIEMAIEESLDQCIYLTASLLRLRRYAIEADQHQI